jgi:hypothetical protein
MRRNNINMIAFEDMQQVYIPYRTTKTRQKIRDKRKCRANKIQAGRTEKI